MTTLIILVAFIFILSGHVSGDLVQPTAEELAAENLNPFSPHSSLWPTKFWLDGLVPVSFDSVMNTTRRDYIMEVIGYIKSDLPPNNPSCLRFPVVSEQTDNFAKFGNFLLFTDNISLPCSSRKHLEGRTGGKQVVNINEKCLPYGSFDLTVLKDMLIRILGGIDIDDLKFKYHCVPAVPFESCRDGWKLHPVKGSCYKEVNINLSNYTEGSYLSARNVCNVFGGHIMHPPPSYIEDFDFIQMMLHYNSTRKAGQWRIGLRGVEGLTVRPPIWDYVNNRMYNDYEVDETIQDNPPHYWDYGASQAPVKVRDLAIIKRIMKNNNNDLPPSYNNDGFSLYVDLITRWCNLGLCMIIDGSKMCQLNTVHDYCNLVGEDGNFILPDSTVLDIENLNPVPYFCEVSRGASRS